MLQSPDEPTLRAIGLLYLVCAHAADGELHEAERDLIVDKVEGRIVEATEETVYAAVKAAVQHYRAQPDAAAVAAAVHEAAVLLSNALEKSDRSQVLGDLIEMAQADGVLTNPERSFITDAAQTFGITIPSLPAAT